MNTSRAAVAAEIRAAMGRADVNQTQLAELISLSRAGLSERLSGHRPFTTDALEEIGRALGVDPIAFLVPAGDSAVQQAAS